MKHLTVILLFVLMISCGRQAREGEDNPSTAEVANVADDEVNVLTAEEQQTGWKLLFDGRSMNGWRTFRNQENDSWEVIDGTLHCRPFSDNGPNKRSDLVSQEQFSDFDLKFEWKISPQANSGVMFHVSETEKNPYETGPEYQIIDDEGYPGDLPAFQRTAAAYHLFAADSTTKTNPVGEWNESRITVKNNRIEHWLNGKVVAVYEKGSPEWKEKIAAGKWKDFPAFGSTTSGHIDLQDHGNEVWFRNIKLKTL